MNRKDSRIDRSLLIGSRNNLLHESYKYQTNDGSSNERNKTSPSDSFDEDMMHGENDSSLNGDRCKGPSDDHSTGNVTQGQSIHTGFGIDSSVHKLSSDQISVTHSLLEFPDDDMVHVPLFGPERPPCRNIVDLIGYLSAQYNPPSPVHGLSQDPMFHDIVSIAFEQCQEKECTFKDQSLLVLDTDSVDACPLPETIRSLMIVERTPKHWQLYVGSNFGSRPHMSIPTVFSEAIVRTVFKNRVAAFSFISKEVTTFSSEEDGFHYCQVPPSMISPEMKQCAIEYTRIIARRKGPATRPSSGFKRGIVKTWSLGLQTQNGHCQYKARYCMLPQSKPILSERKNNVPSSLDKEIVIEYGAHVSRLCKDLLHLDPFLLPQSESSVYVRERCELRREFIDNLDPHHKIVDKFGITPALFFENCTGRENCFLGLHRDKDNCPLYDRTVSCTANLDQVEVFAGCKDDMYDKQVFNVSEDGMISMNMLQYTRSTANGFPRGCQIRSEYLECNKSCDLTKLCARVLSLTGSAVDYQGHLWEHPCSFQDRAMQLRRASIVTNKDCYKTMENFTPSTSMILKTCASFDKSGYYAIYEHVNISFYAHKFLRNKNDAICLCFFFGLLQNGTFVLAKVWEAMIVNKVSELDKIRRGRPGMEHIFLERLLLTERYLHLKGMLMRKEVCKDDDYLPAIKNIISKKTGACPAPRFQYDCGVSKLRHHRAEVFQYLRALIADVGKGINNPEQFLARVTTLYSAGPIHANQFLHACCLSGLVPLSWMKSIRISPKSAPAELIQLFNGQTGNDNQFFQGLLSRLHRLGFKKLTPFFLDNVLCELNRIAKTRKSGEFSVEEMRSDRFLERIRQNTVSTHPDLYFEDKSLGQFQHLFRVVDDDLFIRDSREPNDSFHSPMCKVTYSYASDDSLLITIARSCVTDLFLNGEDNECANGKDDESMISSEDSDTSVDDPTYINDEQCQEEHSQVAKNNPLQITVKMSRSSSGTVMATVT